MRWWSPCREVRSRRELLLRCRCTRAAHQPEPCSSSPARRSVHRQASRHYGVRPAAFWTCSHLRGKVPHISVQQKVIVLNPAPQSDPGTQQQTSALPILLQRRLRNLVRAVNRLALKYVPRGCLRSSRDGSDQCRIFGVSGPLDHASETEPQMPRVLAGIAVRITRCTN